MKIVATPSALSVRMVSNSTATSRSSSEEVGSSMITSRAFWVTAAGDRHHLAGGGAEILQRPLDVDVELEALQHGASAGAQRAPVDQPEAPGLAGQEDVLGHRPVRGEVDLLVDRGDAGSLGLGGEREVDLSSVEDDAARVAAVGAGEDLDQRRLAGPVLADQRHHFARLDLEACRDQDLDAGKALVDAGHGQQHGPLLPARIQQDSRARWQSAKEAGRNRLAAGFAQEDQ